MTESLTNPTVVRVENVHRSFGQGDNKTVYVLRGVDLAVHAGEIAVLYGPSGSGKTTLLNMIGALDRPNEGTVSLNGQNISKQSDREQARFRRQHIAFIFQNYTLIPTYSAMENIDLALRLPGLHIFERHRRAKSALVAVGLSSWADHMPDQLSGGQRQRVALARALALQAPLILADEPTSGLDTRMSRRIMALFRGIAHQQGTAFIIVSHDPVVVDYVDSAYDLHNGQVIARDSISPQMIHTIQKDSHERV